MYTGPGALSAAQLEPDRILDGYCCWNRHRCDGNRSRGHKQQARHLQGELEQPPMPVLSRVRQPRPKLEPRFRAGDVRLPSYSRE